MLTSLGLENVSDAVAPGWVYAIVLLVWGGIRVAQTMRRETGLPR